MRHFTLNLTRTTTTPLFIALGSTSAEVVITGYCKYVARIRLSVHSPENKLFKSNSKEMGHRAIKR